jgi:hypothetical protein
VRKSVGPFESYLGAVERRLPFDDGERAEILDELRVHLSDSAAATQDAGVDPIEAQRTAVDRLGPPEKLAGELTKARRDTTRLLAAAGAGAWGVVRGVAWGSLVGLGFALLAPCPDCHHQYRHLPTGSPVGRPGRRQQVGSLAP